MIAEIDIWRVAYLMLSWYGDTAAVESARRATELAAYGDMTGMAAWHRVIEAIEQLATRCPPGRCTEARIRAIHAKFEPPRSR